MVVKVNLWDRFCQLVKELSGGPRQQRQGENCSEHSKTCNISVFLLGGVRDKEGGERTSLRKSYKAVDIFRSPLALINWFVFVQHLLSLLT